MKQIKQYPLAVEAVKTQSASIDQDKPVEEKIFQENLSRIRSGIRMMTKGKEMEVEGHDGGRASPLNSSFKISEMMVFSHFEERKRQTQQDDLRQTNQTAFSIEAMKVHSSPFKRKNSATLAHNHLGQKMSKVSEKALAKEERKAKNQLRPYLFSRSISSMMRIKSFSRNKLTRTTTEEVERDPQVEAGSRYQEGQKNRSMSEKKNKIRR